MLFKEGFPISFNCPLVTVSKVSFACGFETVNSGGSTGNTKTSSLLFTLNIISNKKYDCTDMEYLKFSSDSNYIIASGNTKHYSTKPNMSYIVIWNINKEDPIQIIEEESLNIQHANICTHNKILYASAEDAIFIWEHKPLQELINDLRSKYLIADNG